VPHQVLDHVLVDAGADPGRGRPVPQHVRTCGELGLLRQPVEELLRRAIAHGLPEWGVEEVHEDHVAAGRLGDIVPFELVIRVEPGEVLGDRDDPGEAGLGQGSVGVVRPPPDVDVRALDPAAEHP
jgi:hypothetical protein